MSVWRFKLEQEMQYTSKHLEGIDFDADWGHIHDGVITVPKDYRWDGCSPKFKIGLGCISTRGVYLGTWDGQLMESGRPQAWRASLFHDVLSQYRPYIKGLDKTKMTGVFNDILKEDGFPDWLRWLYTKAVWYFGPQHFGDRV